MTELEKLISLVLEEQFENPDLNNHMSIEEIYQCIYRKRPTIGVTLSDVEKVLDEMDDAVCDKTYFYGSSKIPDVDYEAPFCNCSPTCITERQIQEWSEFEVCTNCNRPIEGSNIPIGDD